jgi:putative DNA primase/helicase
MTPVPTPGGEELDARREAARELADAGFTALPVKPDKSPALPSWKGLQSRPATPAQQDAWWSPGTSHQIAAPTGPGGHLMFELEGRAKNQMPVLAETAMASGIAELWQRITKGWFESSPSGGYHWHVRIDGEVPGNTKLAKDAQGFVISETRGFGGYVVIAPSRRDDGKRWARIAGGPSTAARITTDEYAQLCALFGSLGVQDTATSPHPQPAGIFTGPTQSGAHDGITPGDDYEAKTSWEDILSPAGWTHLRKDASGASYWRRPGKTDGESATTGRDKGRDRLFVFSTSTPFPAEEPVTKFHAYALLHHNGDHSAAASALRDKGYGEPRPRPARAAAGTTTPTDAANAPERHTAASAQGDKPLDDSPLAQWTADQLRATTCWAGGLGWLTYKNGVWKAATDATITEIVRQQFRALYNQEISDGAGYDRAKKLASLLTAGKIRAVTGLVKGILEVDGASFDQHYDLLNVGNGVVDLASGQLVEHSPHYLFTKATPTNYTPGARHADWDKALTALPDPVRDWLQVRFGQAATGHPAPDDIMPVLTGGGENGKSTIVSAVLHALGAHAVPVPERVLLANPSDHPTELTTLQGARLALIEETPEARHLNVKRLKDTVGTPTMTARRIRQDSITWRATHSLFLTSNYKPRVDETDHGTWRRLALVTFPYQFLKPGQIPTDAHHREGDQGLRDRLVRNQQAREAVLAWIVEGALTWYENHRVMPSLPQDVEADTDAWRADSDVVWSYMREHVEFDATSAILSADLLEGFNQWLKGQNHREWSAPTFTARLENQPAMKQHSAGKRRVNNPGNLSRLYPLSPTALQGKETVWEGIRFSR